MEYLRKFLFGMEEILEGHASDGDACCKGEIDEMHVVERGRRCRFPWGYGYKSPASRVDAVKWDNAPTGICSTGDVGEDRRDETVTDGVFRRDGRPGNKRGFVVGSAC